MIRFISKKWSWALLVALAAAPGMVNTAELTQVLRPGWMRYQAEGLWDGLDLSSDSAGVSLTLRQERFQVPLKLFYGLSEGIEVVLVAPFVWYRSVEQSGNAGGVQVTVSGLSGEGFGDTAAGIKFKLLEDTGLTPAFLVETLLKFPTGKSSVYSYARSLAGEAVERGTGSGSFELSAAGIFSAYMHPFEGYVKLELASRGAADHTVSGQNHHVDYGMKVSSVGGLEADIGSRLVLALDMQSYIYSADSWTVDGKDIQDGKGASITAFRDAAFSQAGLRLGGSTEWYLGPRLQWRFADAFNLSMHAEAGLTPESSPWRAGLSLSGYFHPGLNLGKILSRRSADELAAGALDEKPAAVAAAVTVEQRRVAVAGNLQRYIYSRFEAAGRAEQRGDWTALAKEVRLLEELDPTPEVLKPKIERLRRKLTEQAQARQREGDDAAKAGKWLQAVRAWRGALEYQPDFDPAKVSMELHRASLLSEARKRYLKGISLYVDKEDPKEALKVWKEAQELDPADTKIAESIIKAEKKIQALKRLR